MAKKKLSDHAVKLKNRKMTAVSDNAAVARSLLRSKLQQFRESSEINSKRGGTVSRSHTANDLEHSKSHSAKISTSERSMLAVGGEYHVMHFDWSC